MTADIDAVALVGNRPRNAAHIGALFQHQGLNAGPPQKLQRSRQTGRPRANDYCGSREVSVIGWSERPAGFRGKPGYLSLSHHRRMQERKSFPYKSDHLDAQSSELVQTDVTKGDFACTSLCCVSRLWSRLRFLAMNRGPTKRNPGCSPATPALPIMGPSAALRGTPGLWQTLLHALIRLGLPYSAYGFVSASLGLAACIFCFDMRLFRSLYRLLLPFTYYLCYQYAVIARSYALIAPLLFANRRHLSARAAQACLDDGLIVPPGGRQRTWFSDFRLYLGDSFILVSRAHYKRRNSSSPALIYWLRPYFARDLRVACEGRGFRRAPRTREPALTSRCGQGRTGGSVHRLLDHIVALIALSFAVPVARRRMALLPAGDRCYFSSSVRSSTRSYGTSASCSWLGCSRSGFQRTRPE